VAVADAAAAAVPAGAPLTVVLAPLMGVPLTAVGAAATDADAVAVAVACRAPRSAPKGAMAAQRGASGAGGSGTRVLLGVCKASGNETCARRAGAGSSPGLSEHAGATGKRLRLVRAAGEPAAASLGFPGGARAAGPGPHRQLLEHARPGDQLQRRALAHALRQDLRACVLEACMQAQGSPGAL